MRGAIVFNIYQSLNFAIILLTSDRKPRVLAQRVGIRGYVSKELIKGKMKIWGAIATVLIYSVFKRNKNVS